MHNIIILLYTSWYYYASMHTLSSALVSQSYRQRPLSDETLEHVYTNSLMHLEIK